jgi:hypothetical protein
MILMMMMMATLMTGKHFVLQQIDARRKESGHADAIKKYAKFVNTFILFKKNIFGPITLFLISTHKQCILSQLLTTALQ